jgi:hypothetical protein
MPTNSHSPGKDVIVLLKDEATLRRAAGEFGGRKAHRARLTLAPGRTGMLLCTTLHPGFRDLQPVNFRERQKSELHLGGVH